jgi:hypothetical protein
MAETTDAELIKRSVTKDDYEKSTQSGGVVGADILHVVIGDLGLFKGTGFQSGGLPPYWTKSRDVALLSTMQMCSLWPSIVNKSITKLLAPGFRIEDQDDSDRRIKAGQDLFNFADGLSWIQFGMRHLQDVHLTDNGAVAEIVRASSARGSKIIGLMHLDSLRCTRTGYPDYPVLYTDDLGREHALRADDVLMYADMPSARSTFHGVGLCAADRAFDAIVKISAVELYFREKITGNRALAIHIVSGITKNKLEQAMQRADADQEEKGFFVYKGSLVIPTLDTEKAPAVVTIPLAEIPDGFEAQVERDAALLEMVNACGIPLQDIKPLSGQGLGTGTQTVILDEAAAGMGPGAAWRNWWQFVSSFRLLAKSTTFHFATNDIRDQKAKAEVQLLRAQSRQVMVQTGEITPVQSLNMAADAGDAPKEFLPEDLTQGGTVGSDEKPFNPLPDVNPNVMLMKLLQQPLTPKPAAAAPAQQPRQTHPLRPTVPVAGQRQPAGRAITKEHDDLAAAIGAAEEALNAALNPT